MSWVQRAVTFFVASIFLLPYPSMGPPAADAAELSVSLQREIEMFELLARNDPRNISLRYTVGMLYQLAGDAEKVCDNLYAAYQQDPERCGPELLFHLANNLKAIGENEAAVNFYALAISKLPSGPVNWVLISIALDFIGKTRESCRAFQTVLRLGPNARIISWVEIYMLSALVKVGQSRRAILRYEKLVGPVDTQTDGSRELLVDATSGWITDHSSGRVFQINLNRKAIEVEKSFFEASLKTLRRMAARRMLLLQSSGSSLQDEEWVQLQLTLSQNPKKCKQARFLVIELGRRDGRTGKIGSEIHGFGFGAQMHVMSVALSYAFRTNRTLIARSRDNWWYTDPADCPSRSFQCYFEPLSKCTEEQVMRGMRSKEMDEQGEPFKLTQENEGRRVLFTDCRLDNYLNRKENRVFVPERLRHRGLMWWRSQIVKFMLRLNWKMQALVNGERQLLRLPPLFVGVHVRHGDKKTESSVIPLDMYLEAARDLSRARAQLLPSREQQQRYAIYLSTDDPAALEAARKWGREEGGRSDVDVISRQGEVRGVSTATDKAVEMHSINATQLGVDAIVNLMILSQCSDFVGTFSSNFGRLAFELAAADKNHSLIGASMDVFWHAYP